MAHHTRDPFRVLISTMISLRTKDEVTLPASKRLFAVADDLAGIIALEEGEIEKLIYPAGFYRTKARSIKKVARIIAEQYGGRVPNSVGELTTLPGVGRKTANLVLNLGFGLPAICVDTHVHRISNRFGWVATKTPDQTELALAAILPQHHWIEINELLVGYGQKICAPLSPRCSECPFIGLDAGTPRCARIGVDRSR
ncbi:MAG: endonuclease III [Spirochaetales bacterium]|nr:endonuclease III [Spirochaetales bacterium]